MDAVREVSPAIALSILKELQDQRENLKLIASENFSSLAVQLAQGNLLTDKYAEGYPKHRFYAGCDNVDEIETEAEQLARDLFGADHAFVQPHSGADANLVAFLAIFSWRIQKPLLDTFGVENPLQATHEQWEQVRSAFGNQKLLALDFYSGGHLTHGYRFNVSALMYDVSTYQVDRETNLIDYDAIRAQMRDVRPTVLLAGYSAYSRKIDFARLRDLADEIGAVLMVDMAHFAGLVAGRVFTGEYDPVPYAHVVTSTTHKTLRGPRGGFVLCKKELAEAVDKACPSILGGPLPHVMAAKAVAFREASTKEFREYAQRIVNNSRQLAESLTKARVPVLTGGTDNHMVLVDVWKAFGLTGRQAESALRSCGVTLNRNALPFDSNGPWYASGLRLGTAAVTTLGMGAPEMNEIAGIISDTLANTKPAVLTSGARKGEASRAQFTLDTRMQDQSRARAKALLTKFPLYPEIDVEIVAHALEPQLADSNHFAVSDH